MSELERVPPGVDPNIPNAARVYDYLLGGKDHVAVDRAVAEKLLAVAPDARAVARANRRFQIEAVRHLAREGMRQFLDLGTGIPTSPSIHETVRAESPACRVIYADHDPVVRLHAQVLLADQPGVASIQADLRRPADILADPHVTGLIDFDQPVCVLMVGVLHFVMDDEDPWGVVAAFRKRMAPGSHLVLSHAMAESSPEAVAQLSMSTAGSPAQGAFRGRDEVLRLFEGFELIGPGLVPVQDWRLTADDDLPLLDGPPQLRIDAGVGRVAAQ
ncbi:MAG: SAM-dependent methyltransferase [Nonomuraea sp.]|nr:SAM-dependent methyltransferase [Nonomuraea sp.]NUP66529.1 SAM-dependent methyltransferase [Nonomuraea sp.]NUP77954.1 SAM-dependent methyltransferase [Nonomuraea sp.]NUS04697.1 SAM-dependent methyltransferase [Nonomuraea sp.]NUT10088.1 SAM-dependent methyltransferase [Nonomuraea sp.]